MTAELVNNYLDLADRHAVQSAEALRSGKVNDDFRETANRIAAAAVHAQLARYWLERAKDERPR